jgi:DNA polymerase
MNLHIDIETYSSVDLKSSGAYKYVESIDFEILMVAYAFDDEPVQILDIAGGDLYPDRFLEALEDPTIKKWAHNAAFEKQGFRAAGLPVIEDQWFCTAIKSTYCGLPSSLEQVSKVLRFSEIGKEKMAEGKALIRYFCIPCKPSKKNDFRHRNLPEHEPLKWDEFKLYCIGDVEAEREIEKRLAGYTIPDSERALYLLDQKINNRGIRIDHNLARKALQLNDGNSAEILAEIQKLTGLDKPNSAAQVKQWLSRAMQKEIKSLAKDVMPDLIEEAGEGIVGDVLKLRQKASKTSIKKYAAMLNCQCDNERAHGLFQFYGASRTGRWAGRLIQLQNLPQNHLNDLEYARFCLEEDNLEEFKLSFEEVSSTLSQLIRTAFIADTGNTFIVADFSAIEARVIAWLADESWRLDVFRTHGKIYEASASMMFGVPIEEVTKGSAMRQKGKVAELALGYQGAVGALMKMGGERMGLSEPEMKEIVRKWRLANPQIAKLWQAMDDCAKRAVRTRKPIVSSFKGLIFESNGKVLTIQLPSGRKLFYCNPSFTINKFNQEALQFKGMDQVTRQWVNIDAYGGKFVENIVQAIARDLLAYSMLALDGDGFDIVMHVHDEVVAETPKEGALEKLTEMCDKMGENVPWAEGLPLAADGYETPYYKKD